MNQGIQGFRDSCQGILSFSLRAIRAENGISFHFFLSEKKKKQYMTIYGRGISRREKPPFLLLLVSADHRQEIRVPVSMAEK